jgi:GT2 family glycosyltransferase
MGENRDFEIGAFSEFVEHASEVTAEPSVRAIAAECLPVDEHAGHRGSTVPSAIVPMAPAADPLDSPSASDVPLVSVVIVTWNAGRELDACLNSLRTCPPTGPWEAIVVDNASTDGTAEAIRSAHPWVRLVLNDQNRGLSFANNQGLRLAAGQVIVVSNPDVLYRPGAIDALVDLLQRRPRAAFAFAHIVGPDGTVQTSAGSLPRLIDALAGRQLVRRRSTGSTTGFWWDGWTHDREQQIGHGLEACYAVRREAISEIGLQDERFWLDWEGIDWCARAHQLGWEAWFCPTADVVHIGGVSIKNAELRWVIASHRGMYRYFAKRNSVVLRPLLALLFSTRAAVKAVAVIAGGRMYDRAHPPS